MAALAFGHAAAGAPLPSLESAWESPPHEARLGAYWWWLNGNVTAEAITAELQEMKAKGFGSAVIFDADGASQDGNAPVPPGPTFASPEWRKLFRHALREADRLGISLSLNIQSGWNLGGPSVTPEDAAKIAVWSETRVKGPAAFSAKLPVPVPKGFYQDSAVLAWRQKESSMVVRASSRQADYPESLVGDGDTSTFWVSAGTTAEAGPSRTNPQWIEYELPASTPIDEIRILPRPERGPREGEVKVSTDGKTYQKVAEFRGTKNDILKVPLPSQAARFVRVEIFASFDPAVSDGKARNVQIAEITLWHRKQRLGGAPGTLGRLKDKTLASHLPGSAPDLRFLLSDTASVPGEEATAAKDVVDLSRQMAADGTLRWTVPAGEWKILRFGATVGPRAKVSTASGKWQGYAIDVFDEGAFKRYWDAVVTPLIDDAGPLAGGALKYLHTDSWEIEPVNWTPSLPAEFKARRGYDITPWLPVMAGYIVESREASTRFLNDFRRTLGDLAIDHHYKPFLEWSHARGLQIHPESGGPHVVPIDAQQCLGLNDVPMSEFWAESWRHRVGDPNRFFVKQPASAAHTYGHNVVMAEGFTTVGPHWQERIWNNLKPSFDKACTEGLNRLIWHAWVCSPESTGIPGQQYFAGTHLNPKVTWWSRSQPFFDYINRCQAMLQRGVPVSDVLYYYGHQVPNYTQLRDADPVGVGKGYDYDVISEDALLKRVSVRDGRLVLPEGTSYRMLLLPDISAISLPVLHKLREWTAAGAVICGPKPSIAGELRDAARLDAEVRKLADELWSPDAAHPIRPIKAAREALQSLRLREDFAFTGGDAKTDISYIHRSDPEAEIYFVASRGQRAESLECRFRVSGRKPELWDPVSGARKAVAFQEKEDSTVIPIDFDPCGSVFIIFRKGASAESLPAAGKRQLVDSLELGGPWSVRFDPRWGGPASAEFRELVSWTERPEPGIRYYSGTATYQLDFDFTPAAGKSYVLDLGKVAELAELRLNGKSLGILWTPPFQADTGSALKPGVNRLEIDVVNFWPNRIIGDAALPAAKQLTKTNIRKLTADTKLMESGLMGPVRLLEAR